MLVGVTTIAARKVSKSTDYYVRNRKISVSFSLAIMLPFGFSDEREQHDCQVPYYSVAFIAIAVLITVVAPFSSNLVLAYSVIVLRV